MAGWAPRRLTAVAGFILLLGSVHDFSNGPSAKVRAPTGVAASPRARRGHQLRRAAAEDGGTQQRLGFDGFQAFRVKIHTMGALFIGFFG
jgi:hypothetical protein